MLGLQNVDRQAKLSANNLNIAAKEIRVLADLGALGDKSNEHFIRSLQSRADD